MKLASIAISVSLLFAGVADAADEQLISADRARQISAAGPWVAWTNEDATTGAQTPRIWNGSGASFLAEVSGPFSLGSNIHGQPILIYSRCRSSAPQCAIVQRNLGSTSETVLLRDNARYSTVASTARGLAFTRNARLRQAPAPGSGLYARARGVRHSVRLSSDQPYSIDVGGGKLVYVAQRPDGRDGFDTVIRLLDLKSHRGTLIANVSSYPADCRCTDATTWVDSPQLDGHYVYWVTSTYFSFSTQPPQIEIDRIDLRAPASPPVAYRPQRNVSSFAVSGGVIYYSAGFPLDPAAGVYRVANPDWELTGVRIPVR